MKQHILLALCITIVMLLTARACTNKPGRSQLIIGTHNYGTTYYQDRDNRIRGLEYELGTNFAKSQKKEVEFEIINGIAPLFEALEEGRIDIAAAGLTKTSSRTERFLASRGYQEVKQKLYCQRNITISTTEKLSKVKIQIVQESTYVGTLKALKKKNPDLQ